MSIRLFLFWLLIASTSADAATRPPHLTADQLVAELTPASTAPRLFDRHYASGYMAGVADATHPALWCMPAGLNPAAADQQVLNQLLHSPPAVLSGIAAAVVLDAYRARFPAAGGPCSTTPRLSGELFVIWSKPQQAAADDEQAERQRYANGYLGGVIDATQGRDWCAPLRIKPSELDARGYWALQKQSGRTLSGKAATLLHQFFSKRYPCRSGAPSPT